MELVSGGRGCHLLISPLFSSPFLVPSASTCDCHSPFRMTLIRR